MSKALFIEGPVSEIVNNFSALLSDAAPGDYFVFAPSVGIVRARKSSQISWQWWGIGCPKARLTKILFDAPKASKVYKLPVTVGVYGLDIIELLIDSRRAQKLEEGEEGGTLPEETDKKKKKDKKKKDKEGTTTEEPTKLSKKVLEATRTKKEVKQAVKACGIWDKKQCKEVMGYLTFPDGESTLKDIMADIEAGTDCAMTEETLNLLVANL